MPKTCPPHAEDPPSHDPPTPRATPFRCPHRGPPGRSRRHHRPCRHPSVRVQRRRMARGRPDQRPACQPGPGAASSTERPGRDRRHASGQDARREYAQPHGRWQHQQPAGGQAHQLVQLRRGHRVLVRHVGERGGARPGSAVDEQFRPPGAAHEFQVQLHRGRARLSVQQRSDLRIGDAHRVDRHQRGEVMDGPHRHLR